MKLPFVPVPHLRETYQRYLTGPARTLGRRQMLHSGHDLHSVLRRAAQCFPDVFIDGHGGLAARVSNYARRWHIPFLARELLAALDDEKERE